MDSKRFFLSAKKRTIKKIEITHDKHDQRGRSAQGNISTNCTENRHSRENSSTTISFVNNTQKKNKTIRRNKKTGTNGRKPRKDFARCNVIKRQHYMYQKDIFNMMSILSQGKVWLFCPKPQSHNKIPLVEETFCTLKDYVLKSIFFYNPDNVSSDTDLNEDLPFFNKRQSTFTQSSGGDTYLAFLHRSYL